MRVNDPYTFVNLGKRLETLSKTFGNPCHVVSKYDCLMETLLKSANHRQLGRASKLPQVSLLQHAQKAGAGAGVSGGEELKLVWEKKNNPY